MDVDPNLDALVQTLVDSVFEGDYIFGIHDLLHSRHLVLLDSYDYEGKLYSRSAVLLNGICHITVSPDNDCDYILSLGALPFVEEGIVNDWSVLPDRIDLLAESCLDEWQDRIDGEEMFYGNFSCFSMDQLVLTAESGKRDEIYPILNLFMEIFQHYSDVFIQYANDSFGGNFTEDDMTDETLENAFITFIKFINEKVIPKLNLSATERQKFS